MVVSSPRASYDAVVKQATPNTNYGTTLNITVNGGASVGRQSYLYFPGMPPVGANVSSAILRVYVRSGFPATALNITAERVTTAWKEGKVTWNNVPSVTATHAGTTSVTNPPNGTAIDIDVTTMVTDIVGGSKYFGIRLRTTTTTVANSVLWSSEGSNPKLRPQLIMTWNLTPLEPVGLTPANGQAVTSAKPVFGFAFHDNDGDALAALQLKMAASNAVDGLGVLTTPTFDSRTFTTTDESFDANAFSSSRTQASVVTTISSTNITAPSGTFTSADTGQTITGTGVPGGATMTYVSSTQATLSAIASASGTITATIGNVFPSVTAGQTRYWQVRGQDASGAWSPYSDVVSFNRTAKGTFTVASPPNGGTVSEVTPPILSTSSLAQEALQYVLSEDDGTGRFVQVWQKLHFGAPANAGVAYSFTVPSGYIKRTGRNYRLTVRSWDTVDRIGTPGDAPYSEVTNTFSFVQSATPAAVTVLTATSEGSQEPGVRLNWNRVAGQAAPDFFSLKVDGVRVETRIDPVDVYLSGTSPILYQCYFYNFAPRQSHTFEVEAVVANAGVLQHSQGNDVEVFTSTPVGIWLVNEPNWPELQLTQPKRIRLLGSEQPSLEVGESSQVFTPIGRRDPVRVYDVVRGLEGSVSGTVRLDDVVTGAAAVLDNVDWLKRPENLTSKWRVIVGNESFIASIGPLGKTPTRRPGELEYALSFAVEQVGDFQ